MPETETVDRLEIRRAQGRPRNRPPKDLCPGWHPGVPMDPARERAIIRLEVRRDRNARAYLKLILNGRRQDPMTPAERAEYNRDYWAANRERILERRRQARATAKTERLV